MDQTHLHLLITHLPIFGTFTGAIVLVNGIFNKSLQVKFAAYYVLIVSALGAVISYITGESAEETAEHIQGVAETAIEAHEDFAIFALWSLSILGIVCIAALIFTRMKNKASQPVAIAILILTLISCAMSARTGYLGGQIRHTEISQVQTLPVENQEFEHD